jgi:hypothetical protein
MKIKLCRKLGPPGVTKASVPKQGEIRSKKPVVSKAH